MELDACLVSRWLKQPAVATIEQFRILYKLLILIVIVQGQAVFKSAVRPAAILLGLIARNPRGR